MTVPFHFVGEDVAPGVKVDSGIMSHNMVSVDVSCLGIDLPEYIEVDCSELGKGESIHLGQVALPEGVELSASYQEQDMELPVASVLAPKGPSASAAAEDGAEGEEGEEGAAEE